MADGPSEFAIHSNAGLERYSGRAFDCLRAATGPIPTRLVAGVAGTMGAEPPGPGSGISRLYDRRRCAASAGVATIRRASRVEFHF